MATAQTSIVPPKAPDSTPKYTLFDSNRVQERKNYEGPSPYAERYTEGPSYKPKTLNLEPSGKLDGAYEFAEVTPQIGREYPKVQVREILKDEEKLRDLAITVSRRGVVFFRNQDLTVEEQKELADKLGRLTGKPKDSTLHIHPTLPAGGFIKNGDSGETDPEVSIISSKIGKQLYFKRFEGKKGSEGWQ